MMYRRLYFLFPDTAHTSRVVEELERQGIARSEMHAVANPGIDISMLPSMDPGTARQVSGHSEKIYWTANLILFFVVLTAFIFFLLIGAALSAVVAGIVLLASFFAGFLFVSRVPNVHLDEFSQALKHGEILLVVDVPKRRVAEIEHQVHRLHPEAVVGGVGWGQAVSHG